MYVGLKQPRGDGERYVTPARATSDLQQIPLHHTLAGLTKTFCIQTLRLRLAKIFKKVLKNFVRLTVD